VFALCVELGDEKLDGSYVALERAGVAVINGTNRSGRRRFTLTHEIGHHVFADSYSAEWVVESSSDARERLIDAFAIHFLMPRSGVTKRWQELDGKTDPRGATLALAAEYGASWSAACAQLRNLDLIDDPLREELAQVRPGKSEYLEREIAIVEDLRPPQVSAAVAAGVIKAYRKNKITRGRAIELLRGTVEPDELPAPNAVPLDAMTADIRPLD